MRLRVGLFASLLTIGAVIAFGFVPARAQSDVQEDPPARDEADPGGEAPDPWPVVVTMRSNTFINVQISSVSPQQPRTITRLGASQYAARLATGDDYRSRLIVNGGDPSLLIENASYTGTIRVSWFLGAALVGLEEEILPRKSTSKKLNEWDRVEIRSVTRPGPV